MRAHFSILWVMICFVGPSFADHQDTRPLRVSQADEPWIISESGTHKLTRNITLENPASPAIMIKADNVVLDLRGFTVAHVSPMALATIKIEHGLSNVTIKNGTIQTAISTEGAYSFAILSMPSPDFSVKTGSIVLTSLSIEGMGGIRINQASYVQVENCRQINVENVGIEISNTYLAILKFNEIKYRSGTGIRVRGGQKHQISFNDILRNMKEPLYPPYSNNIGIYLDAKNSKIIANRIWDSSVAGIFLGRNENSTNFIQYNRIMHSSFLPGQETKSGYGIVNRDLTNKIEDNGFEWNDNFDIRFIGEDETL